jgi:hypothetical protein
MSPWGWHDHVLAEELTMKIAILGDIHGNIEALKAAYAEVISIGVDKMYHLGDLGGYAPFVNEVVDFLVAHDIEGVQGTGWPRPSLQAVSLPALLRD